MTKDILYSDLLDIWFADHRLRIAASTAYGYEMALPYIKKYFNAIYAADITQEMIYDYIQYLETVMAPTSVRLYCNIINISMNYGVKYHYLFYNPAWDVAFPPACQGRSWFIYIGRGVFTSGDRWTRMG